jgi:hypothetical protein
VNARKPTAEELTEKTSALARRAGAGENVSAEVARAK